MRKRWQDQAAEQTRQAITDAVLQLMKDKKLSDISVKDIHQKTGYSRQTFYRHYNTVEDVVEQMLNDEYEGFIGDFLSSETVTLKGFIEKFLSTCKREPEKMRLLMMEGNEHLLLRGSSNIILKSLDFVISKEAYADQAEFYLTKKMVLGTLTAITNHWIENGFRETEEELASFIVSNLKIKKGVRKMSIFDNMFFMSVGAVSEMKNKMEELVKKGKITQEEAQRMFEDLNEGRTLKDTMNPITLSIGFSAYMNQRISELLKDLQEKGKLTTEEAKEYVKKYIPEEMKEKKAEAEGKKDESEYVRKEDFMKIMEKLEAMEKKLSEQKADKDEE